LSESLNGVRAVFLSDTHLGPRIPAAYVSGVVEQALSLKPDLVLLGGDYVHAGSRYIRPAVDLFRPFIEAHIPTVAVLGNHDWYNSRGLIGRHLSELGVRMVDNSHVLINARTRRFAEGSATPSEALCIAGVGDLMMDYVDIRSALEAVPEHMPRLLLSHNPDVAELAPLRGGSGREPPRIDLMLSGHMHGGQIALPMIGPLYVPSRWGRKYAGGLVKGPKFPVLVSRGVGMSICPVRICVPPELLEVTLVRA
jgi:predicted MPP superfamily phosphohydrolase